MGSATGPARLSEKITFAVAKGQSGVCVFVGPDLSSGLKLRILLVDALSFRQHALMEDARD